MESSSSPAPPTPPCGNLIRASSDHSRADAVVGEAIYALEFLADRFSQGERIGIFSEALEFLELRPVGVRAGTDALKGRLWPVIVTFDPASDPDFALQLDRGKKQILQQSQLAGVQIIDGLQGGGRIIAGVRTSQ